MALLIRSLRKTLSSPCVKSLLLLQQHRKPTSLFTTRNYISDMRKSAFQGNILRLLRNEIQYEHDRCPPIQPITKFNSFIVDDRPGEQWIKLKRKFGDKEDITIEATMFDGSIPVSNSGKFEDDVQLHVTFVINISKGGDGNVLEILCSAWPDAIEVEKLFVRGHSRKPGQPYSGPEFKELDDELQNSVYEFLEERGINDELGTFLHEYMKNKDKTEFINWLGTIKSFVEKK